MLVQRNQGKVIWMKWVVVSFDQESNLYTVQNEQGRTCRANADAVVYGVEGRKLPKANKWAGKILPRTKPEIKTFHKKFKTFSQLSRIPIVNHG